MLRQPHRKRAQAAQRQEHVIGAGADAEQMMASASSGQALALAEMVPNMMSEWPPIYLVAGLHADVDALIERAMIQRRRPGVVVDDERAARMRDRGDRGNVGHLEGLRARRFDQHRPGVGLEQAGDAGADQRIEIAGLDAVAGEHAVAEIARRPVGVVADQQMVAGLQHREQGGGDRGQARGRDADAGALRAFQRHQRVLQRRGWSGCRAARTGIRARWACRSSAVG